MTATLYGLACIERELIPGMPLSEFWRKLREKSRVEIDHPNLPTELRDVVGTDHGHRARGAGRDAR